MNKKYNKFKYNLYQNGMKINSLNKLKKSGEMLIVEKNYITSWYWWLKVLIVDIFMGFIGSTYQNDDITPLQIIQLKYKDIVYDEFSIILEGKNIKITGVESSDIVSVKEEIPELMMKRVKNKKKLIVCLCILILIAVFIIIIALTLL